MKRLLATTLLSLVCFAANAEWIEINKSPTGDTTYVDPATKKRKGNIVRIWGLEVYGEPILLSGMKPARSIKSQVAYNCDDDTFQILYLVAYPDNMGLKQSLFTIDTPDKWKPIPPDSVADTILRFACKP